MSRRVGLLVGGLAVAIGLSLPGGAAALGRMNMQALLNSDGTGMLVANAGGELSFSWEECDVGLSLCRPVGIGREFTFGDSPDGTVFKLVGGEGGVSPVWHGNLKILTPPSIEGTLRANELVTPVRATWEGGWDGDFDATQLAACETPTGEGCRSITATKYVEGCANGAAYLDPTFVGDYLRVADSMEGPGTVTTLEAWGSPYDHPIWPADGNTAVAMVGRIGPPTHGWTATCGPPPLPVKAGPSPSEPVKPRVAKGSISRAGVASVRCSPGCRAVMIARRAGRGARVASTLPSPSGNALASRSLRLREADIRKLGPGRVHLVLQVNGKKVAERTVTFLAPKKPQKESRRSR